ncbi:MAG: hypothetical protein CMN28_03690 [Salinisphaeraceae bacterium]|jgi:uncharacterized protein YciI|nr:hypothetical protein [Salinisphaeraceae bacterium]
MLYAIIGWDHPGSAAARQAAREAHLARLQAMQDEGRLVLAGPFPAIDAEDLSAGVEGSLLVIEFDDLQAAQAWADDDPYVQAGVYREVFVKPFRKVFG